MPLPTSRRSLALLAAGAALAVGAAGGFTAAAAPAKSGGNPNSDAAVTNGVDSTSAVVGLSLAPLATDAKIAPAKGKKVDFNSSAAKSERAKLVAQRNTFKKWLQSTAPRAQVTGEYDVAVNAVAVRLNGTSLSTLRSGPGVVSAGYQGTYSPTSDDPDLSLVKAKEAWAATATDKSAGAGMKVGIIDTGIDVTHPCFAGGTVHGLTNDKVIVAKVFANKAQQQGLTALAVQDHGTHVAGTVACNVDTAATVDGVDIPYDPSGVAPAARLGSYNVFPGHIENARSEDILNALDAAALDGMDVINMSLGGDAHGVQDLLTNAVDNLDKAGIVVAVSAGNEGPGHYTVGSPGSAERALTAGASSVGHFIAVPVDVGTKTIATAAGDFPIPAAPLTARLAAATGAAGELGLGCAEGAYPDGANNKIALVSRGDCTFGNKVSVAEKAGAVGVVIVNNAAGDPTAMAADDAFPTTKPAVMAGLADKAVLVDAAKNGVATTITTSQEYTPTANGNIMGSFSSQGPTDVDYRVKPDLVAPGVNVLSSIPNNKTYCDTDVDKNGCWAFFNGTSMASPHLAGTAAVVKAAHPGWSAEQIRSAITNTAAQGALANWKTGAPEVDPLIAGAGLDDVLAAVGAKVALSSVSTSFGAVPSGSGKVISRSVTISDLSGSAQKLSPQVVGDPAFSVSPGPVDVPANGTATLTITYNPTKAIAKGDHSATLDLGIAHAVLYAFAK